MRLRFPTRQLAVLFTKDYILLMEILSRLRKSCFQSDTLYITKAKSKSIKTMKDKTGEKTVKKLFRITLKVGSRRLPARN